MNLQEPGNFACKDSDGAPRMTTNDNEHQCKEQLPGSWAEQVCLCAVHRFQIAPGASNKAQFVSFNFPNALICVGASSARINGDDEAATW
jgi:hypothetical protein